MRREDLMNPDLISELIFWLVWFGFLDLAADLCGGSDSSRAGLTVRRSAKPVPAILVTLT